MVNMTIDGRALSVLEGTSILRAAESAGLMIPHFCHHPAFPPEGSCRMCFIEIDGDPKLELACATAVREGQVVRTTTDRVLRARREVLGFLLAEHPLDCPVCDKAGECRLQDYYEACGGYAPAFGEARERRDKKVPLGGRLLLDRERCVLCTLCVRFLRDVAKTGELGVFERGVRSEIGVFEGRPVDTIYAGNLVDLCPVGAITDTDFRFRSRVWFLEPRPAVCPRCARGCAIVIDSVSGYPLPDGERMIFRIRPRENPEVNGFWMCDLGRYGYKSDLEAPRRPAAELAGNGRRTAVTSSEALSWVAGRLRDSVSAGADRTVVILNSDLTNEELRAARALFVDRLGLRRIYFSDPPAGEADALLLTADRTANRRGAAAAGFDPGPAAIEDLGRGTDLLLVFGARFAEAADARTAAALSGIPARALFSPRDTAGDGLFDALVPVPRPAEKAGSFTNFDGRVQAFPAALPAPAGCVSEAEIIGRLSGEIG